MTSEAAVEASAAAPQGGRRHPRKARAKAGADDDLRHCNRPCGGHGIGYTCQVKDGRSCQWAGHDGGGKAQGAACKIATDGGEQQHGDIPYF